MKGLIQYIPLVFLGGGIGATLRFLLSVIVVQFTQKAWAGTLFVNIIGCIALYFGVKFAHFHTREMNFLIKIGLISSLTTFSAFAFEIVDLLKSGNFLEAGLVLSLNILFGVFIGIWMLR
ncbi:MAG: CrcB family protein [Oligoflexia bacterium]|nr:CrcB family protein [Oligoflexia bacterium]